MLTLPAELSGLRLRRTLTLGVALGLVGRGSNSSAPGAGGAGGTAGAAGQATLREMDSGSTSGYRSIRRHDAAFRVAQ